MPGKMRECDGCHKIMRSDNLKNHMKKYKELNQKLNVSNENIRYPFADNSSKMSKSTKNGGLGTDKVQIEQPSKKPQNHGTVATIFPEKREKPIDSLHSKTLNPKISALIDDIVNEEDEPPEKIQRKDLAENSTDDERQHYPDTLDLTSKVVTDENEDYDEDGNDYEDDENGDEDDDSEDDDDEDDDNEQLSNEKPQIITAPNLSKEIKIIINKF